MSNLDGRVVSVNVGTPRTIEWQGKEVTTSIWKSPVIGRVAARGVNLDGDDQANRLAHGGPDKYVYSYAWEDTQWWEETLGRRLEPGVFGENLTLAGVDVSHAVIGEEWEIGEARFQVRQPRIPCEKLDARMGERDFRLRFAAADRPGAYLMIVREGELGSGDAVRVVHRPAHGVTVADIAIAYHRDRARVARLLAAPDLTDFWRQWATKQLQG